MNHYPLVSVPVITYNSSKFVIETLESVKSQTYPNIELVVSDDGSTDGTVQLCRDWIEQNKSRFYRVELLTVEHNTGTAGNMNRAEAVCHGEWVKGIAGDDRLLPKCIETFVEFCIKNRDAFFVFSDLKVFGSTDETCRKWEKEIFHKSFFEESPKSQLDILLNERNCVPASTFFYNRQKMIDLCVRNDERIPLLEDWPKWINLLKKGAHFSYIDQPLVGYRITDGVSTSRMSPSFYRSNRLFYFYYLCPYPLEDSEILKIVQHECSLFDEIITLQNEVNRLQNTRSYKVGRCILKPLLILKHRLGFLMKN